MTKLAEKLEVPATEIIKKLMSLGVMASLNNTLSFDDAEMVVIDYDKTLKSFESQDKVNFEKLEINDNASVFSDISEFLANIGTQYFIIADDSLENDFIKKAILHFKYLNKNYGILSGKNKFKIEIVNNYTNVLFDRKINDLNRESFDIYYI